MSETGRRFTRMVLHPSQVDVIHRSLPLVYLTGPPGVGKSLVLVLRALHLLRQHRPVHVVSTWYGSLAAAHSIVHQLRLTAAPADRPLIHLHCFDLNGRCRAVQDAVKTLMASASEGRGQGINVIADEVKDLSGRWVCFR